MLTTAETANAMIEVEMNAQVKSEKTTFFQAALSPLERKIGLRLLREYLVCYSFQIYIHIVLLFSVYHGALPLDDFCLADRLYKD